MAVYKEKERRTWYVSVCYTNWQGEKRRKVKRGFKTKREAQEWEDEFLHSKAGNLEMTFGDFVEIYLDTLKKRVRESTIVSKQSIIDSKIMPYFKRKRLCDIKVSDVVNWQNKVLDFTDENGQHYSQAYLNTIHTQLSAIFNHAVRYYDLPKNPAKIAGNMGKKNSREMMFWTKEEYLKFSEEIMDRPVSFYAFEILYWCGLRLGEMLALTLEDFDFKENTIRVNKSIQRVNGEDIVTDPKTPKSNRKVNMPDFLAEEMKEYFETIFDLQPDQRVFPISKGYMHSEMTRGSTKAGVKRIRIHDLRHSHVSLLINMGFTAMAIAERVGHESIDITYRYAHLFPNTQKELAEKLSLERN